MEKTERTDAAICKDIVRAIAEADKVQVWICESLVGEKPGGGVCVVLNGKQFLEATPDKGESDEQLSQRLHCVIRDLRTAAKRPGFDLASITA